LDKDFLDVHVDAAAGRDLGAFAWLKEGFESVVRRHRQPVEQMAPKDLIELAGCAPVKPSKRAIRGLR
jgi:hypothetical protein